MRCFLFFYFEIYYPAKDRIKTTEINSRGERESINPLAGIFLQIYSNHIPKKKNRIHLDNHEFMDYN
ncbi:MAG: hypothetical protein A2096_10505 [Spirochaetes bacterium GWF1_41_5]|nr:MAG: hypothetical protein A2096_10505 [Spirochaetes bacterium GWF1_41_5]HBE04433.1 hypothetical protein [Spirochaetia bacterium]